MDTKNSDQESGNSKEDMCDQSVEKSTHSVNPIQDLNLFPQPMRRSPRAAPRVPVKFPVRVKEETGTKKQSAFVVNTGSNSNGGKVSSVPSSVSGYIKTVDGRKVDGYCWLCHKTTADGTEDNWTFCAHCPRVFHHRCLVSSYRFKEDLCPECRMTSVDGSKLKDSITSDRLTKLLLYALNESVKVAEHVRSFKYTEQQSQDLIFPVDLAELQQKINNGHYMTTNSFLADVKWIRHNLQILGVSSSLMRSARKFVAKCKCEMLDIETCPDCYEHRHSSETYWFAKTCSVDHTLVWVKIKGFFQFWPAKEHLEGLMEQLREYVSEMNNSNDWFCNSFDAGFLIAPVTGNQQESFMDISTDEDVKLKFLKVLRVNDGWAHMRFFGTYETATIKVPDDFCYRLSEENPNPKIPKHKLYSKALEELRIYIGKVNEKYGDFTYYPLGEIYDPGPENISTEQVTKKRKRTNSVPTKKVKVEKIVSIPHENKTAVIKLNRLSDARVKSISCASSGSTPHPVGSVTAKRFVTSQEEPQPSKRAKFRSNAGNRSVQKNAMKHRELNTTSPQDTVQHPKNCNRLPLPKENSTATSTEQVANSSSLVGGGKNTFGSEQFVRTNPKRLEKTVDPQNSLLSTDSVDVSKKSVDHPVHSQVNSGTEAAEPPCENSGTHSQDEVVFIEDDAAAQDSLVLDGGQVPSIPGSNSEEPVSGTGAEVLNSTAQLDFCVEEQESQNDYVEEQENQDFLFDHAAIFADGHSVENMESRRTQRPQPFSVDVPRYYNENTEPVVGQQPFSYYIQAPVHGYHHPEDRHMLPVHDNQSEPQYVCVEPLPAGLSVEKFQKKASLVFREMVEEMWHDFVNSSDINKIISGFHKEIEELKAKYKKDFEEVSKNTSLILHDREKKHAEAIEAVRKKCEQEKQEAINEIKKKQKCAHCGEEALFYYCGSNSCCDHSCHKAHFLEHTAPSAHLRPEQPSPDSSDTQRNLVGSSSDDISQKFYQNTHSQQSSRGSHNSVVSNDGQMHSSHQLPTFHVPFHQSSVLFRQSPVVIANSVPASVASSRGSHNSVKSNEGQMLPSNQLPVFNVTFDQSHIPFHQPPIVIANSVPAAVAPSRGNPPSVGANKSQMLPSHQCSTNSNFQQAPVRPSSEIPGNVLPSVTPNSAQLENFWSG